MLMVFSRRWILATLLVVAAAGVMVRLGIWQLDRLAERRGLNAAVTAQLNSPPLALAGAGLDEDLTHMQYRSAVVTGTYDYADEVVLRNQVWQDQIGVYVLTPLVISGTDKAVLVDRGWIPFADQAPDKRAQYEEKGVVTVRGMIRQSQTQTVWFRPADPPLAPGQTRLDAWSMVNVGRIAQQVSHPLLPVYIQQAPDPAWTALPYRSLPVLDLSEGPHMSYALQWFSFAAILLVGYPFFVRGRMAHSEKADDDSEYSAHDVVSPDSGNGFNELRHSPQAPGLEREK